MKLYNDYNSYLREKFGAKVYRIGLDAGFTCPNRDGTKGTGGCAYCNASGSRAPYVKREDAPATQLISRISELKAKYGASKFIAYFQAFTNTYAPPEDLKKIYDTIMPFKEVVGLSIGTRPDAVDEEKLEVISSYADRYEVWVEYGLQTANDATLKAVNRGHGTSDFERAVRLTRRHPVKISAHVILGLPGETGDDVMNTARYVTMIGVDGLKIHPFHVLKGSPIERDYAAGRIRLLEIGEYTKLACDFLENIPDVVIIQRLTGHGSKDDHLAPAWALDKTSTINAVKEEFLKRGTSQGSRLKGMITHY